MAAFLKLALVIAVIFGVWYVAGLNRRLAVAERALKRRAAPEKAPSSSSQTEELVACPECGAYVSTHGAKSCGRAACPYR